MELLGLKGIEAKREIYIRPLIECERTQIEEYCKKNKLNPRIDCTNLENIYTRNKIRNELITYIQKEFNPNIISGLNRLSNIAKEENDYLENITQLEFKNLLIEKNKTQIILDLKKFNTLGLVIKKRILLYTINELLRNYARNKKNTYRRYDKAM